MALQARLGLRSPQRVCLRQLLKYSTSSASNNPEKHNVDQVKLVFPDTNTDPHKSTPPLNFTGREVNKSKDIPQWAKPLSCQSPKPRKVPRPLWKKKFDAFFELTKPRLTALVVLSAMSSYALAPEGGSVISLAYLTLGTALCSASANSINQGREPEYDRLMTRTRKRPVASNRLQPKDAFAFAAASGTAGISILAGGTNAIVAGLGAANIGLYGGLYTSLKRKSISNTWVGAVVGAIPPLMGWATCSTLLAPGPWILALLLYSWQFPHFMSLSYSIADEYKHAGYVMSAWTNPLLTARVALRHSIAMFPICISASYFGLTDSFFILDSSIINGWQAYAAFKFYQQQKQLAKMDPKIYKRSGEHKKYAKLLFWASVIHLPLILLLAMLHKKGRWDWLFGSSTDDDEESHENEINNVESTST